MSLQIRAFRDDDLPRIVEIHNRTVPDQPRSAEQIAYDDRSWDASRYERARLVAERDDRVVGWGQIGHNPWRFHPRKYELRLEVDPAEQSQGIGGALHERLIDALRARDALLVRAAAQESRAPSLSFLTHRGYQEVQRYWMSNLDVARFDFAPFVSAPERVARQGIAITTIDRERARDPATDRAAYELFIRCEADEPSLDEVTALPFEEFLLQELNPPNAIPEATFLARDGDRFVGVSSLLTMDALPDTLDVGFTGVAPEYRGRGIAMALKLETIRFAQSKGYRRIRTGNLSQNLPMLRINLALGFEREPAWITFQKDFE